MRTIFCLLMASFVVTANAQDVAPPRIYVGLNAKAGGLKEKISVAPTGHIYKNSLNDYSSRAVIENGTSVGFEGQVGYFFDKNAQFGIATGVMYMRHNSTMTIDSMHFEYESTDSKGETFRQLITTSQPIKEELQTTSINIPILLKYRVMLSNKLGVMIDAGIVYNAKLSTSYNSVASFDYEAIYKFEKQGNNIAAVYDNSPEPSPNSWLITADKYFSDFGDGKVDEYFQKMYGQGYNVGLNKQATTTGEIDHPKTSIGFLIQPSVTMSLTRTIALNLGGYYMVQKFSNDINAPNTMITDKVGTYSSILSNTLLRKQYFYGINLGLNISF